MVDKMLFREAVDYLRDYAEKIRAKRPMSIGLEHISTSYGTLSNYDLEPTLNKLKRRSYVNTLLSLRRKVGLDILVSDLADKDRDTNRGIEIEGNGTKRNRMFYLIDRVTREVTPPDKDAELRKIYIEKDKIVVIGNVDFYTDLSGKGVKFYSLNKIPVENLKIGELILQNIYKREKEFTNSDGNSIDF
jgi:hypothetical protein